MLGRITIMIAAADSVADHSHRLGNRPLAIPADAAKVSIESGKIGHEPELVHLGGRDARNRFAVALRIARLRAISESQLRPTMKLSRGSDEDDVGWSDWLGFTQQPHVDDRRDQAQESTYSMEHCPF